MVVYTRIHLVIVSIHTPTQGVTTSIMYPAQASQFQSTHPRRVWPFCTFAMCSEYVSIHTPTQGVTAATIFCSEFNKFQSTHPRRVWHIGTGSFNDVTGFNPHTHAGCDIFRQGYNILFQSFNPHTHAGCDIRDMLTWVRERRFNPHTHAGCDIWKRDLMRVLCVSIHTPTQGVTRNGSSTTYFNTFQSTHPRRVWRGHLIRIVFTAVSIHTPTQGVTLVQCN